jgi:hypothetical protein
MSGVMAQRALPHKPAPPDPRTKEAAWLHEQGKQAEIQILREAITKLQQ